MQSWAEHFRWEAASRFAAYSDRPGNRRRAGDQPPADPRRTVRGSGLREAFDRVISGDLP
jgi:hypothetical protein